MSIRCLGEPCVDGGWQANHSLGLHDIGLQAPAGKEVDKLSQCLLQPHWVTFSNQAVIHVEQGKSTFHPDTEAMRDLIRVGTNLIQPFASNSINNNVKQLT